MSFKVISTVPFERKLKKLSKRYPSLKQDLLPILEELSENPTMGDSLGKSCYKIRVLITSKGKGKSGRARLITYVRIAKETVFLLELYDKSEKASISDQELKLLIEILAED